MRFIRYNHQNQVKPGIIDAQGKIHPIDALTHDITPKTLQSLLELPIDVEPLKPVTDEDVTISSPLAEIGKIICVGLNYQDHADEQGVKALANQSFSPKQIQLCAALMMIWFYPKTRPILTGKPSWPSLLAARQAMSAKKTPWIISPDTA